MNQNGERLEDHSSRHGKDGEFQFQYAYWPDHEIPAQWTRMCDHFNPQGWLGCSDEAFSINTIEDAVALFNKCKNWFSSNGYSRRFRVVDRAGKIVIPDEWEEAGVTDGVAVATWVL